MRASRSEGARDGLVGALPRSGPAGALSRAWGAAVLVAGLALGPAGASGAFGRPAADSPATALDTPAAQAAQPPARGRELYRRWCAGCHGEEGRGDGPAADRMLPRPRDFTQALYQIRTTPSGALPTDDDLLRVIDRGMPGTAMPGWEKKFSRAERLELVQVVKSFSRFFETMQAPEPYRIGKPPRATAEALAEGRELYERIECWKCHGRAGRGDGPSAPTLRDDADLPIRAADLTENWNFNGGGTASDIFTRLRTGLDGTPMPTFSDLIDSKILTETQLWHLALYVRSLSPERPPVVRDVIEARRIEGALPATPDDPGWNEVEGFYVPLVGQVIVPERWFAPSVDGVFVQAVHNGEALALRLVWHDPSRSPDPSWLEWQEAVLAVVHADGERPAAGPRPDVFAVQFPTEVPETPQLPYFLMGDRTRPVYLWRWTSEPDRAQEAVARGMGRVEPLAAASTVEHAAVFDQGEWRLVLRRPLRTEPATGRLQFETGRAIPIAFFAWDGDNGEDDTRSAVSAWYYIYLAEPTPPSVYITPVAAVLLTAGFGWLAARRAQRGSRGGNA